MKPSILINIAALITIAALGYGFTLVSSQPPAHKVIVQPEAPVATLKDTQSLPDFAFTTPDGKTYHAHDFKNKIILLNFWASWCAPCIKEFPNLLQAAQNYNKDIVLIALSSDIDEESMLRFVTKLPEDAQQILKNNNVFIALDQNNITKEVFQTYRLPETIIIDRNLTIRKKLIGADWDLEYLENDIQRFLSDN